jgi:hypothetical protein
MTKNDVEKTHALSSYNLKNDFKNLAFKIPILGIAS